MGLFGKPKAGGFMDEIRCDEQSYLIWKWRPAGAELNNNSRENAIRWGSSLRVKDGEVAVFVYNRPDGVMEDFIEGPCDRKLDTGNLPVLASIVGLAYAGGTPFQAEVYFINTANIIQTKFGIPYFDVYDPRFMDFGVPVAVRGTVSFKITNYREFVKLHRLTQFSTDDFNKQIKDAICRYIKDAVTAAPAENNIPVIQIENKIALINDKIEYDIGERLRENFGVTVSGVDINSIEIDKTSDGYEQLMAVTRKVTSDTIQAQTAANIKNIHDKQRIEAENYEQSLRVQREEGQYAMHKQTQSANLGAFQSELQANVGIAGAEALGQMGANGAGSVDLGGQGGAGFNPAAMMAAMAVGGVVGQNMAGAMNNALSGINGMNNANAANQAMQNTMPQSAAATPPPIPTAAYHIAVNGQTTGPYDMNTMAQLAANGQLTAETLVWKNGMASWARADSVAELVSLVSRPVPPPIPTI